MSCIRRCHRKPLKYLHVVYRYTYNYYICLYMKLVTKWILWAFYLGLLLCIKLCPNSDGSQFTLDIYVYTLVCILCMLVCILSTSFIVIPSNRFFFPVTYFQKTLVEYFVTCLQFSWKIMNDLTHVEFVEHTSAF